MSKVKLEGVGITKIKVPEGKASKRLNRVKACPWGPSQGVKTASLYYIKHSPHIQQVYTCRIPTGYLSKTKWEWKSVFFFVFGEFSQPGDKKKRAGESNKGIIEILKKTIRHILAKKT